MGFDNMGGVFHNTKEDGTIRMNVKFDDVFLELCPQLKNLKFLMRETPFENRTEKSPIYIISAYKPKEK